MHVGPSDHGLERLGGSTSSEQNIGSEHRRPGWRRLRSKPRQKGRMVLFQGLGSTKSRRPQSGTFPSKGARSAIRNPPNARRCCNPPLPPPPPRTLRKAPPARPPARFVVT
eukprot:6022793-Alexandrium_andersonii.AAC.1